LKVGISFVPLVDKKCDRVSIQPVSLCTSLTLVGLLISTIVMHLSGFAFIPLQSTTNRGTFQPEFGIKLQVVLSYGFEKFF